jgi:hypothetical protein
MNVRIKNEFYIRAGVWIDDEFLINNYTVICHFITTSYDEQDHIVCLNRINFLFDELNNVCFINQENQKKVKNFKNCKINVIELPQDPVDQIIGLVIFYKLNAICEQKMICTDLDISSDLGGNIHYLHSDFEETSAIPDIGWWNDIGPNLTQNTRPNNEKIVQFSKQDTWQQYDLNWNNNESQTASIHSIKNES